MVGEHTLGNDPDCKDNFCLTPQKLKVESIKIHEKWNGNAFKTGNDIALVRVQGNIKLFVSLHFTSR